MFAAAYYHASHHVEREKEITIPLSTTSSKQRECIVAASDRKYLVNLASSEGGGFVCVDTNTGVALHCRFYPMGKFVRQLPFLFTLREGICRPLEVFRLDEEAFVLYPPTYGDLHSYLKRRKSLPEATAARYFRQIVNLVESAHESNISLRDLKLKKFLFADETR